MRPFALNLYIQMPKSIGTAWSLKLAGTVLVAIGFVKTIVLTSDLSSGFLEVAFWVAVLIFGGILFFRGQKYGLAFAEEAMASDPRAPILFLRSFADEVAEYQAGKMLKAAFAEAIPGISMSWGPREQADLAKQLRKIGPYIAVGRPGEPIPELGAARKYIPDQDWQQEVSQLMQRAALIVAQAGQTPGLTWEFSQMIRTVPATKVLLILPRFQKEYDAFRHQSAQLFPHPLPDKLPKSRLVAFHQDWKPYALEPRAGFFWTVKPVLDQNGIPVPK